MYTNTCIYFNNNNNIKKLHNKPLKYQTKILKRLTKTTTMKYYGPERKQDKATIYDGKVSKRNNSDDDK